MTKGVEYVLDLCKDAPTYGGQNIGESFKLIKDGKIDVTELRRSLKNEVLKRLVSMGYWDYIPIPKTLTIETAEKLSTEDSDDS